MHTQLKRTLAATAAVTALVFPAAAFGQQSAQDAYTPQGQVEQDVGGDQGGAGATPSGGGENTAPTAASSNSGLPFTGMDVALLAGAGTLLLGAGVGVRRLTHRQDPV